MKKITICGVPASGKSTLANKIGSGLGIPVYHLDKISWKDDGVFASQEEITGKVSEILEKSEWIIEGSLPRSKTFDMRIREADVIILMDVPIWLIYGDKPSGFSCTMAPHDLIWAEIINKNILLLSKK